MGCAITDILTAKEISIDFLSGKVLAVDAMNQLYMFLSSIRGADGSYLQDSKGNITSHLSGLFFRFTKLISRNIRFVFVFDGKAPDLKVKELERRKKLKLQAQQEYDSALAREDPDAMKKFASRTTKITYEMKQEAKKLIHLMGMPVIDSPGEGEAQACSLVLKGQAYAVMSQDADALLFGSPKVVKNLSFTQKRKQASRMQYQSVSPEIIDLRQSLSSLEITHDQLIALGMLVGTDYNIGGIKGIGPKKALKLVKENRHDFAILFSSVKWDEHFDVPWTSVFNLFKNKDTTEDYSLEWRPPDADAIVSLLVDLHEFQRERVEDALSAVRSHKTMQKALGEFF